jgi:hypothetical protein
MRSFCINLMRRVSIVAGVLVASLAICSATATADTVYSSLRLGAGRVCKTQTGYYCAWFGSRASVVSYRADLYRTGYKLPYRTRGETKIHWFSDIV